MGNGISKSMGDSKNLVLRECKYRGRKYMGKYKGKKVLKARK